MGATEQLFQAAKSGSVPDARKAIADGAIVDARDNEGLMALQYASIEGHEEIVALLLSSGADANASTRGGNTPLHGASAKGRLRVMEMLLTNGARVDERDHEGGTALLDAACHKQTGAAQLLLAHGADVNAADPNGDTALMLATKWDCMEMVALLLEHGAKPNARQRDLKNAALMFALDNEEIVGLLLEHGADPRMKNVWGVSPLAQAQKQGRSGIVALFERANAPSQQAGEAPAAAVPSTQPPAGRAKAKAPTAAARDKPPAGRAKAKAPTAAAKTKPTTGRTRAKAPAVPVEAPPTAPDEVAAPIDADLSPLIEGLRSPDNSGKYDAFKKLEDVAKSGDQRLLLPLIEVLRSGSNESREFSASLLGSLGDKRAFDPLIQALGDSWWCTRYNAVVALGQLGDRRAIEPIRKLAESDENDRVGGRAGMVLAEVLTPLPAASAAGAAAPSVESHIAALASSDEDTRQSAWSALIGIGAPAVEPLTGALKSGQWGVRWYAARALGRIEDARAVEPLVGALSDENEFVRAAAAIALGLIGDGRAMGPLTGALDDADEDVRGNATRALQAIGPRLIAESAVTAHSAAAAPSAAPPPAPAEVASPRQAGINDGDAMDSRCEICHQVPSGRGKYVDGRALAECTALWRDLKNEAGDAFGELGVAAVEGTRKDYADKNTRQLVCGPCIRKYSLPLTSAEVPAAAVVTSAAAQVAVTTPASSASAAPAPAPATAPAPAPTFAAPVWMPTHFVPPVGMAAWAAPDPSRPPVCHLTPHLDLVVEGSAGVWAQVRAVNGWRGWVDGRLLISRPR